MATSTHISGTADLLKKLEAFDFAVNRKILRKAITSACKPVMEAAERNALRRVGPGSSGLLSVAMDYKVKAYAKDQTIIGLVGANSAVIGDRRHGRKMRKHWPMKVAHLVENGHLNPKTGHRTPPHPFLRPAWDATKAQAGKILEAEISRGIEEAVK